MLSRNLYGGTEKSKKNLGIADTPAEFNQETLGNDSTKLSLQQTARSEHFVACLINIA
jgi:hypothetical protein